MCVLRRLRGAKAEKLSVGCKVSPQESVLSEARIWDSKHIKYVVLEFLFQAKKMRAIKLLPQTLASPPP